MSREPEVALEECNMVVKRELHTKCVNPRRLSQGLKELVGRDAQFKVEMRHNVYNIECSKDFDLEELLRKCQGRKISRNMENGGVLGAASL